MEIKRDIYLNRLIVRRHNHFVKVITGIRRCGKSYLLNNLFYRWLVDNGVSESHIIRFAFDSAEDLARIGENLIELDNSGAKVDPIRFIAYINERITDSSMYYLLLDEVQRLGSFESVLNGYLRKDNIDLYVTGSNSRFLSSDIITEFEGRGDEVRMHPLSFAEYAGAYDGSLDAAWDEYMTYGGLPAVVGMPSEEQRMRYLETQMSNVFLKDIVKRFNLQSDDNIAELVDVLASGIASLTNPVKLSDTYKSVKHATLSAPTISKYIEHLEDAFIVSRALRYDIKGKHYIDSPYKLYFEDIGLRNARLNFRQIEPTHLMENIIYNELRMRGFTVDVGTVACRERTTDGREIRKQLEVDFVANLGSKRYYLQSAYAMAGEDKRAQEIRPFDKIQDSFKKIIVVGSTARPRRDERGYVTMGIKEFLLDENSLDL